MKWNKIECTINGITKITKSFRLYHHLTELQAHILLLDYSLHAAIYWHLLHQSLEQIWSSGTDKSYFSLDGTVNRHNCTIWADQNPHKITTKGLHSEKVCVWMEYTSSYKLQPFFFTGTVNQHNYTDMLRTHLFPELRRRRKMSSVIFQEDGAPPHFTLQAREFLQSLLPADRIVSRGVGLQWPHRSPDLSLLCFYFLGYIESMCLSCFQTTKYWLPEDQNCSRDWCIKY